MMRAWLNRRSLEGIVSAATVACAYWYFLRPWHLRWGARAEELASALPGDNLAESTQLNSTHAITIDVSASELWPWLVQIGQNKAGFYSYSCLENFAGCHIHNADHIVREWQDLKVGDPVWLHPKAPPLHVLIVQPERALVLEKCWAFILKPLDAHRTRLIVRGRGRSNPDLGNDLLNFLCWRLLFEPTHFIMERKMMLGIKHRAEAAISGPTQPSQQSIGR